MNIALSGIIIFLIAALGGWIIVKYNSANQPRQVKAVLFGLYFWGLVFFQLLITAGAYYLLR
jgi:hypothetical protein